MKILPNLARLNPFLFIPACFLWLHACKKTDFPQAGDAPESTGFFTPKKPVDKTIQNCIDLLKQENDRRNFVGALPRNIGRPLWEKLGTRAMTNRLTRGGDSGTHYLVIPFTTGGAYLTGLLIAIPSDTGYTTSYYSSDYLKSLCYAPGKDVEQVENLLGLFMMMENYVFKRESFYHIPRDLFPTNALILLSDSTKVASMADLSANIHSPLPPDLPCYNVPSGTHHPMEEGSCDWREGCGYCSGMYCGNNFPNLPGPPPGPGGPPPNTPTPTPGGGGTGGGNPPPPAPVPCDEPFYLVNPCDDPPGPVPPIYELTADDIRIFNQLDAEDAEVDALLSSPTVSCEGTKRTGNINFNGPKEHWLIQLDYISRNPLYGEREYAIPQGGPGGNTGFADIVNKQANEIFEIKPDNDAGISQGRIEVQRYVMKANQFCPTTVGSFPPNWHPGNNYSLTILPSTDPTKFLKIRKPEPGLLLYEYINKQASPQPLPIAIPASIMDKLRYLVDRLRNNINDFDRIIAQYMRQHPDLVTYLKGAAIGAAVAIVVGTILEDIATLGGGILDDWASFVLAYRIVRFAWAL